MRLRVGLVGLGEAWQQRHASALRALAERFEVRAICDQVGHRAEQAAAEFDAVAVDGYRALAGREDIDALLILAPQWYGLLPILAACESGKAVYCAAGLDLNSDDAAAVKSRVEQAGIAFVAEFPRRHLPATVRLKELLATRLGAPRILFCHQRSPAYHSGSRPAPCSPQRAAMRVLVELVDWCRYVVDRPASAVSGVVHGAPSGCGPIDEDYLMLSLDFSDPSQPGAGPLAQISCGRYIPAHWQEAVTYRPPAALQAACERGIVFLDLPSTVVWFDEAGRHQESLESERPVGELLLTQFHRAVTSLVRRTCDLEDAVQAMRIVQAVRQSHEEGRRIAL